MKINNSARLSYQLMTIDDAELLYQLDQDPEVMRFISDGNPSSRETIYNVLVPRMQKYLNSTKGWGIWQVNITETNEYIGWVLVRPMNFFSTSPEFDNLELGWRFFQTSWGKGFASEAAQHIKDVLAAKSEYKKFSAIADENNLGSIGVMKNIGMSYIKTYLHIDPLFECNVAYYQIKN
ncbi:GNAT family N-acetyltransferase [Colwellia sp. Bg11-12]|jgi:RimJ/RimL family protein N-acetyltransferase|uniref:GNAT family N-acetyltransferase n=1 Tax=Colwellia sp. Bg11-12 TaxID=2759817 RepID=UPI0015F658D1|nr:GNAT family N-acetyltransferase [Colwellia sp. Bg11-12]MBA6263975.1 GNAT family N-acetyltransferase [Colwellia sp. Bg11-12]